MKEKIFKANLVDAEEMSTTYPDSFYYPLDDIEKLKVGDIVKVCDDYERFWVIIEEIRDNGIFVGKVNNGLVGGTLLGYSAPYNFGDLIFLKKQNIYEIWDEKAWREKLLG